MKYNVTGMFSYCTHAEDHRKAVANFLKEINDKDLDVYIVEVNEEVKERKSISK